MSQLETLAASMAAGTWAELPTTGLAQAFTGTGGSTGIINPYAMAMVRDSVTKRCFFMGSDHGGNYTPATWPNCSYRFVSFSDDTNAWEVLPNPPFVVIDAAQYTDAHGYDLTAINVNGREIFRLPYNNRIVRCYSIDAGTWTDLAALPEGNYILKAITYFPERNALVVASMSGGVYEMVRPGNTWVAVGSAASLSSTWMFAEYNPVLKECLFGSSNGTLMIYSAAGTWKTLGNIPVQYRTYDGSGLNGFWIADPASGKYLLMTDPTNGTGRNVFQFDSATDTYSPAVNPPDKHLNGRTNWAATPVPEYGVSLWLWADGGGSGSGKAYLYKHSGSGGGPTPPANQPPVVDAGPNGNVILPGKTYLNGIVTDDGLPGGTLSIQWTGPAGVVFDDPTKAVTGASFPSAGTYTLTLTANDGALTTSDATLITVTAPTTKLVIPFDVISKGNNGKSYRVHGVAIEQDDDGGGGGSADADFLARSTAPGVVKVVGFDQASDVAGRYGSPQGLLPAYGTTRYPELDTAIKASGKSSLRFTLPAQSPADAAGSFFCNLSNDFSVQFDAGESFFYQWRQRFSTSFLSTKFPPVDGAWKQSIFGTGSTGNNVGWPGIAGSCSALEIVVVGGVTKQFPMMYNSCTGSSSHGPYTPFEEPFGPNDFKLQNARPSPFCLYSGKNTGYFPPAGNCFGYWPDEWMTFQVGVQIGQRVGDEFKDSHVQMWAAREGQPSVLLHDWIFQLSAGRADNVPLEKFGQIWLTPYMTGKDATVTNPVAYVWYDELIVSRKRIADPVAIGRK